MPLSWLAGSASSRSSSMRWPAWSAHRKRAERSAGVRERMSRVLEAGLDGSVEGLRLWDSARRGDCCELLNTCRGRWPGWFF